MALHPLPASARMHPAARDPDPSTMRRYYPMPAYSHITAAPVFPVFIDPYMSRAGSDRTRYGGPGGTDSYIYLRRCGRSGKRGANRHQRDDRQFEEVGFEDTVFHALILNGFACWTSWNPKSLKLRTFGCNVDHLPRVKTDWAIG